MTPVTNEMIYSALTVAVVKGLLPREVSQDDGIKNTESIRALLEAALGAMATVEPLPESEGQVDSALEAQLTQAWRAGFSSSAEGFNGEVLSDASGVIADGYCEAQVRKIALGQYPEVLAFTADEPDAKPIVGYITLDCGGLPSGRALLLFKSFVAEFLHEDEEDNEVNKDVVVGDLNISPGLVVYSYLARPELGLCVSCQFSELTAQVINGAIRDMVGSVQVRADSAFDRALTICGVTFRVSAKPSAGEESGGPSISLRRLPDPLAAL